MAERTVSHPSDSVDHQPISARGWPAASGRASDLRSDRLAPDPDGLRTVDQIADYLAVSRSAVYRLVQTEGLPAVRVAKSLRFRLRDIEAWLDGRTTSPTDGLKEVNN